MKKIFLLLILFSAVAFSQTLHSMRQSSVTLGADSTVTVSESTQLGAEEYLNAIGFDANWTAGGNYVKFKVYDEVAGAYKYLYDKDGLVKYPAGKSRIIEIETKHIPLLKNFLIVKDSSGTTKKHYGTSTVITLYKKPAF